MGVKRYPAATSDIKAGRGARVKGDRWIFRVPGWWFSIYARPLEPITPPRGLRIDGHEAWQGSEECGMPCMRPEGAAAVCKDCPTVDQCCECDRWVIDIDAHDEWHARQDDRIVTDLVADAEADRVYGSRKATRPPEEAYE